MTEQFNKQLSVVLKSPELASELEALGSGMSGDILAIRSPAQSRAATGAAWTNTFEVVLKDSKGNVCTWYNGTQSTKITVGDTSSAGVASASSPNLVFKDGRAKISISGNAAAWLAADTATLTLASMTINGVTVTGGTMVVTITA